MRRLIPLLAASLIVAGPLAAASDAMAKDHNGQRREQQAPRGGGREQGMGGREQGGGRWNNGGGGGPYRQPEYRGGGERYGDPRSDPRNDPRYEQREYRADPRMDPRSVDPRSYGAAPRRGGFLGDRGGQVIEDPSRYRLRAPPRGYDWVRTPGGMALVQQGTGRVYDVVPND